MRFSIFSVTDHHPEGPRTIREFYSQILEIMLQAWEGKPFSYHGLYHHVENMRIAVTPIQKPHPPIWVAILRADAAYYVGKLGVPDKFFGEEMLAVVRPQEGEQLTEQELRDFCKGQISHQKIPRYFQFVDVYPLTASGKVQKFVLRQNAIKTLGLEEAAQIKTA